MEQNENLKEMAAKLAPEFRPNSSDWNERNEKNERASDTRQIWQTTLRELQMQMGRADYDSWIKNLALLELRGGVAWMSAPSSFAKRRLESDYSAIIQHALTKVVGEDLEIRFSVDQPVQPQLFEESSTQTMTPTRNRPAPVAQSPTPPLKRNGNGFSTNGNGFNTNGNGKYLNGRATDTRGRGWNGNGTSNGSNNYNQRADAPPSNGYYYNTHPGYAEELAEAQNEYLPGQNDQNQEDFGPGGYDPMANNGSGLNPRYLFDRYVEGSSNRVATAAARRVAEMPGYSYNPLFIYGGVGLGKTHLLHAIGHKALESRPNLRVLYVSTETFTNDLVNSIREGRMEEFRLRYRTIDILMIDDIQFIAGKDRTQEEFFHTFNSLVEANKQVVISSDRAPRAMMVLEERLRSRFEGGLTCDVQLPDYEMRLAILRAKAEHQAISPIPTDVLEFIAHKIQSNIRELEGALTRVVAFALHNRTNLSVEQAAMALNDMVQSAKKMVTPTRIVEQVAQFYNLDSKELRGRSRSQDIVLPRQIAMHIIREHTEVSLVEIGQELGGRDHTTVMHGIDKMEREIETNPSLRQQINTIVQIIYSEGGGSSK